METKYSFHINGIEGFWGLAKVRLTQFKGLPKHTFHLHLKETEWRYNHRRADKYNGHLQILGTPKKIARVSAAAQRRLHSG